MSRKMRVAVHESPSLPLPKSLTGNLAAPLVVRSPHSVFRGCYEETPITLPPGREVSIKIFPNRRGSPFTKVVYELPNSAMGLGFEEVSLKSGEIWRQWLLKASVGQILTTQAKDKQHPFQKETIAEGAVAPSRSTC
jgi:hypothetical protein